MTSPAFDPHALSSYHALWSVDTRWEDNDHYGHVNNVKYYSYFDTAVNGWLMESTGVDVRDLSAIGLVAESGCKYLASISFPDTLTIGIAVERLGERSITYSLGLFVDGDDAPTCAATCRFVHVYVDGQSRRPVAVPPEIAAVAAPLVVG
ncbi:acyl-CoA thioesterase [Gordonia sp. HY002]|uniref:acyl-CoA thioesterase n=1 Tax=Gordonia zhenghanii TaxID=2911516 RepID=UPI001EEF87F7|nr:thioesterase family protein [Gordonia zhenghanii]MCF8571185.1 acyl-CoA thioesterase [Gordonia zhenghanii]MCF8606197.1 acyl-CoA thioesterase [Gordonia zhenghanii]